MEVNEKQQLKVLCYTEKNWMKGRVDRLFFIMNLEYLTFKSTHNSSYMVVVVAVDW